MQSDCPRYASLLPYIDIDPWNETPKVSEKGFELLQTIMEQANQLEKRAPFNEIVDNSYAK